MERQGSQPVCEHTEKGCHELLERVSWAQFTVYL